MAGLAALAVLPMTSAEPIDNADRRAAGQAPPVVPPHPYSDCKDTSGRSLATGLPPLECYPSPFGTRETVIFPYAGQLANTDAFADRIKTRLVIPPVTFRAQLSFCSTFVKNYPCPLKIRYPREDLSVVYGYFGIAGKIFVKSPPGSTSEYGIFPSTTVHTLVFGSVPVTARIELRQTVTSDGFATPLRLSWLTSADGIPKGRTIPGFEEYGPAPASRPDSKVFWNPDPHITGPVTIQVSALDIDGRPVAVGSDCHAVSTMNLTARAGFYDEGGVLGQPGEYAPLGAGNSYLHGTVDIPAFADCGSPTENLSPLISSFVSGSGTLVNVTQTGPISPFCTTFPADRTCPAAPSNAGSAALRRGLARLPPRIVDPRFTRQLTLSPTGQH